MLRLLIVWLFAGWGGGALAGEVVLGSGPTGAPGPDPAALTGYVEGRIVALGERATVELRGGGRVEALLPTPLPAEASLDVPTLPDYRVGERVELYFSPAPDGGRQYVVSDWVRRPALLWLVGLFLLVSVAVGRFKVLRAFIATSSSLAITIAYVIPSILGGSSPVLTSLFGIGGMLLLAIYFVHGVSWSTTAAFLGTAVAVVVTMLIALYFTDLARLTGLGSDEALLISAGAAQVDLRGLFLAGLLIGALGALTDITIVQASVVRELSHVNPDFSLRELYRRGMNVGLDHIGSLIDTLVLAYTGAALPLLVLLTLNDFGLQRALNFEFVAAEVVNTIVGSIGLVLAVPLTTLIAALMFRGDRLALRRGELELGHSHGSGHEH
jgi:uncharacterized membrane protein